jgi:hypothetical protein
VPLLFRATLVEIGSFGIAVWQNWNFQIPQPSLRQISVSSEDRLLTTVRLPTGTRGLPFCFNDNGAIAKRALDL